MKYLQLAGELLNVFIDILELFLKIQHLTQPIMG